MRFLLKCISTVKLKYFFQKRVFAKKELYRRSLPRERRFGCVTRREDSEATTVNLDGR